MKKIWLTTLAIGAFAVPVGVASAQTGDDVVDDTTTTTQVCDGDQLRLHDGSGDGTQARRRAGQGESDGEMVRDREQARTGECDGCDGEQLRERQHDHDGSGGLARQNGRSN